MSDYPDGTLPISIIAYAIASLPVDIIAQTIGNIAIDIAAQTVGDINVNIAAQDADININISAQDADVNVNITNASITVTGTVAVTGTVSISGTVTVAGAVTVSGTVSISGTVTVSGSVTVSGTVSISGTVTITGSVTVTGTTTITGAVTITSGTINIQTSGGTNIVVDKLTQGAYLERRFTLESNGVTPTWATAYLSYWIGKFFPRGCRGNIDTIELYCRNTDTSAHEFYIHVAPYPNAGPVYTGTISIGASAAAAWRSLTLRKRWNYDSMFIYVNCDVDANQPEYARDTGAYDFWTSSDEITFYHEDRRAWIKANMKGATAGDLPVSGTINAIIIPNATTGAAAESITVPTATETSVLRVEGFGTITRMHIVTSHDNMMLRIYIDGTELHQHALLGDEHFEPTYLNAQGFNDDTQPIKLVTFNDNGECIVVITIRWTFKVSFELKAYHTTGSDQVCHAGFLYDKLS